MPKCERKTFWHLEHVAGILLLIFNTLNYFSSQTKNKEYHRSLHNQSPKHQTGGGGGQKNFGLYTHKQNG
jgi:hypothetical protein